MKVIFISGLGHSGSTLLAYILGNHPEILSVGEIYSLFKIYNLNRLNITKHCTCGHTNDGCTIWQPLYCELKKYKTLQLNEYYDIALAHFMKISPEKWIVDSSKNLDVLKVLMNIPSIELKVINIIKDVRAYTISMIDKKRRNNKNNNNNLKFQNLREYMSTFFIFLNWYHRNLEFKTIIKQNNINSFQLGYEELCCHPHLFIDKLCDFIGVSEQQNMQRIENSDAHLLFGNRMRSEPAKKVGIMYDNRWFYERNLVIPQLLFRKIMQYNKNEVYRNYKNI